MRRFNLMKPAPAADADEEETQGTSERAPSRRRILLLSLLLVVIALFGVRNFLGPYVGKKAEAPLPAPSVTPPADQAPRPSPAPPAPVIPEPVTQAPGSGQGVAPSPTLTSPQEKKAEGEPSKEQGAKEREAVERPVVKATPGGRFSVQVGAMAQEANAQGLSQKLEKLGYGVTIRKGRTSATQHVVLVAASGERSEADALVERLKAEGVSAVVGESDGGYRVEAGRSAVLDEAIDIARELQKKGFTPKIASETAGATLYLVRVGQFASRGEASKRAKELRAKGFPALIVKR